MAYPTNLADACLSFWEWLWNSKPPSEGGGKVPFQQQPQKIENTKPIKTPPPPRLEFEEDDFYETRRQIRKIAHTLVTRMSAQRKKTKKHKELDFRKTINLARQTGGIPIMLKWKAKPKKKSRLLVILDTSGSMSEYNVMLLQIIQAIRLELSNFELFIFATELEYVTNDVERNWEDTINNLSQRNSWDGGTDIPIALETLYEEYNKLLNRSTTILMLSDLKSHGAEFSARTAKEIRRLVKNFYIFNCMDIEGFHNKKGFERYKEQCVDDIENAVDKIFYTTTLEDMANAVQNVCLR